MAVLLTGWVLIGIGLPCFLGFVASYYKKGRMMLVLLGLLFMKLGFLAQDREEREAKGRHGCGKITRNDEYPALPERSSRGA